MLFLVISAVICGANDWQNIERFGKSQTNWLRKYLPFANGIPSHDTLGRVFSKLSYHEFANCFIEWTEQVLGRMKNKTIAIDGKRLRGSYDKIADKSAAHIVSAFSAEFSLCLGHVQCSEKSNEITAIPKLLDMLCFESCTVTIDAMGCQKDIAQNILDKNSDYILALKNNHSELYQQVESLFKIQKPSSSNQTVDTGHGRVETRKCDVIENLSFLDDANHWPGLKSVIKINASRFDKISGKEENQIRYYISSCKATAVEINQKIRSHWSIENNLHRTSDVNFLEDKSRRRLGHSAQNFNIIIKMALTILARNKTVVDGTAAKRCQAGWDYKYRDKFFEF